ncbi:Mss4p nuclear export [Cryptotrichosporon argae]
MPNPQLSAVSASAAATIKSASKRKSAPTEDEDDSGSESGSDVSMINVDFDFYNLNPDVDQIAIKRLLRQSLSHDEDEVDVHPLAELVLAEAARLGAGSSIKTDGEESDPWGLVAAVDVGHCASSPALAAFTSYLLSRLPPSSPLRAALAPGAPTALVFSLRMLNLPLPLIPPLYRMLLDETKARGFEQYVLWGRGYKLQGDEEGMGLEMDAQPGRANKKRTQAPVAPPAAGHFPYHAEEAYVDARATAVETYAFKRAPARDADTFGVEQYGRAVLVSRAALELAVADMEEAAR